jgi:transcriptional regulator of PTS gene
LYIEGRELKAALINLAHDILYESSLHMNTDVGNAEFLSHLFELITCVSNSAKAEKIIGIGIAVPGTVQPSEKIWLSALRFPKIQNLNFMGIQKKLKLPVQVYKDTHSILQYQILMNPSYKTGSTILFKWDFAIGFGYANNSIILDSAYGRYGSIGHAFIINPFGKKCICGKRGCLETETGTWALLPQLKKDYPSLNHDERSFSKVFRHKDIKNIHPIQNALKHIKTCLYSICYFFYPDRILFVGPFTENEEIFANIENFIKKSMITEDYAQRIKLQVIENAYHGCFHSSAHNLFNAALEPFLRVRY